MKESSEKVSIPHFEIVKFDPNIDNLPDLEKIAESAYKANLDFFTRGISGAEINFVYSDDELITVEKSYGVSFQDWHKAFATDNKIWLFSPHLSKGKRCQKIMSHEMAHLFTNKLFCEGNPAWIREGIAGVVAGEFKDNSFKSNFHFEKVHNGLGFQEHPIYDKSIVFTRYLIDNFGKNKLFTLLGLLPEIGRNNSYEGFCKLFNKIYNKNFEQTEEEFMNKFYESPIKNN
jgi:hypothetical protein